VENKVDGVLEPVSNYTYQVNPIGQRVSVQTAGSAFLTHSGDWIWGYDDLGQVVAADRAYEYDAIGNRLFAEIGAVQIPTTPGLNTTGYTPNALNQYDAITSYNANGEPQTPLVPVHDADGNTTRGPVPGSIGNLPGINMLEATLIEWDAENRMTSCRIGNSTFRFEYDHLSRLSTRKLGNAVTRRYHYDGWNRIAEYLSTTLRDTFTWGLDLSNTLQGAGGVGGLLATRWVNAAGSPDYFPTYDGNGNVSEYLTSAGGVAVHYQYDPFGNLTEVTGDLSTRFQYRFSTKPRDINTGLYYYGYRQLNPLTGRWVSRDPIEEAGGVNLYGFAGNDSLNLVDLLGLMRILRRQGDVEGPSSITCSGLAIRRCGCEQFMDSRTDRIPARCKCEVGGIMVRTGKDSFAELQRPDGTLVRLGSYTISRSCQWSVDCVQTAPPMPTSAIRG
jgi:RHS repeat-associated protein